MNYDDIILKCPYLKDDIQSMLEWFSLSYENRNSLKFDEKEESILKFKSQIIEMTGTLKEFPRDFRRVKKIYKTLKAGGNAYPIFVDKDNFIMEGRHRIVSQYLAKISQVLVFYVSVQNEESLNEIKFSKVDNIHLDLDGENSKYEFDINNNHYIVDFENIDNTTTINNSWSVSFRFKQGTTNTDNLDNIIKALRINPYSNTGLGNEYKVYSYVISSIIEFINKVSPNIIYFDARDKKRSRIYGKIANQLLSNINGYKLHSGSVINGTYSFILAKNNIGKDQKMI